MLFSIIVNILVSLYIITLYKNIGILPKILYACSLTLFNILLKISLSTLMLENTTTFLMFKITNPIPLELKLHYLTNVIFSFSDTTSELFKNQFNLMELEIFFKTTLDITKIAKLNTVQINEYACQLLNMNAVKASNVRPLHGLLYLYTYNNLDKI